MKEEHIMQCNRCKKIFDIKDAAICYRQYGGSKIRELKCPICSSNFRAYNIPKDLDRYLYVDKDERYYEYT